MWTSRRLGPLAGLLFLCAAFPSLAWAPETRVRMTDEAVRFMPPSLRLALEKHRSALLRGMLQPLKQESADEHRAPGEGGSLDASVAAEAAALTAMLEEPTPFARIAEQFGRLAHYVADGGFPPGVGAGGDARYKHFGKFCESRRERFRLVFYGHDDPALERGDYRAYMLDVIERAAESDGRLAPIYARHAEHGHASDFDDRSVPFAVGSLSYSRSINDVVRVWLTVWERAGGDLSRTPYMTFD